MSHVFREGRALRSAGGYFLSRQLNGASSSILNGFWNITAQPQRTISFNLKNASGAVLANTAVKYMVCDAQDENPYTTGWGVLLDDGIVTTDSSGYINLNYKGNGAVGTYCYVAIFQPASSPTESMIWKVAIA